MTFSHSRAAWLPLIGTVIVLAGCGSSSAKSGSTPTAQTAANPPARASQTAQAVPAPTTAPTATLSGGNTAAIVNGQKVPMSQFRVLFNYTQREYANVPSATAQQIAGVTMNQVIASEITRQYATRHGISVSQSDINGVVKQQEARYGGAKGFASVLARAGLTMSTFKDLITPSLLEQKVARQVVPMKSATVPVARVRHILIGTTINGKALRTDTAAHARAQTVLSQLKKGGNFAQLVQKYSDDTGKTQNGGYYTVHPSDQMVPQFLTAAFQMPVHQPGIIKSVYGYHVFEVMSRGKGPATAQQQTQMQQQRFAAWINQQERHATIKRIATVQSTTKK